MTTTTCPSHEDLTAYLSGRLSDADLEEVAEHLETCPECQALLTTLDAADDTLVATLRRAAPKDPCLEESQCRLAIGRVHAMFGAAASTANQPRDTLCGQSLGEYYLTEELGRGGMGRVYKALHTKLDRMVAVKVCPRPLGEGNASNRFAREMKAVGRLVHPNIVQAYDAREIDGTAVLIMELVDGLDLAEIVRRVNNLPSPSGRGAGGEGGATSVSSADEYSSPAKAGTPAPRGIPVPDACELVRQTALALQCADDHGLVHRDIKPSNIMLARSGEVKLLDLGLARFFAESGVEAPSASHVEEMTGTGQAMGTADYMAPEQASDSRTVDIRADIYSLGCTLYKLLAGRAPFSGPEYRTTLDKMNAHVHQPAPPVRKIVPEVPEGLTAVLDRMLAKDPSARFATPAEVAEAISPFCAGADLPALLKQAESSQGQQGQQGQQGEGEILPSPSGRGAGGEGGAVAPQPSVKASRWKSFAGHLLLLLLVGGLCFALGIVIRIKKDGETTTIEVPPKSKTRMGPDGSLDVTLPETQAKTGLSPAEAKPPQPAGSQISVIYLKNAKAQDVAILLEHILGPSGLESRNLATGPIKITTDARLNALVVQANHADLEIIKKLMEVLDAKAAGPDAPGPAPMVANPAAELEALRGEWKLVRVEKGSAADKAWKPNGTDSPPLGRTILIWKLGHRKSANVSTSFPFWRLPISPRQLPRSLP